MHYSGVFDELRAIRTCREGGADEKTARGTERFTLNQRTMKTACLTFNPIQENTYVVWDDTLECVVVDAGNSTERENAALRNFIEQHGLKPVAAVNTHGHFDHVLGVEWLRRTYGIPFALSSKDRFLLDGAETGSTVYGVKVGAMPSVDLDLDEEPEIRFGRTSLQVIPTPGHTPGHVSLYEPESKTLFTGDTLFRESIGRTDLPGGDYSWIMRSILDRIVPLGEEVRICPGHGPESTIGHELLYNPFIVEVLNDEVNYRN
ncbi:putative metallo-hydrolase [Alistipes sp. CHKCI003]|nr:putative metallo-hydrolase [Alistipes sp. CHKCI003]